ncbi:MAG: LysM peptidoglycan-binding domain-containing protein [Planctomycetota bacterium]|nr:MAG: LysM peptidoglycan-binding domain-containing protein [Planctomycetota bacterium]
MKSINAWMLIAVLTISLTAGCQEKIEEPVAQAPAQQEPTEIFPEEQVPAAEPQPVASPPVDTTASIEARKPETKPQPAPKESYAPPKKVVRYHVVRKGETLQKISQKYYGTTKKWRALYKANRKTLSKGPDKIQIGMKLVIP